MEVREEKLLNGQKVILIKDCYNANLDSMMKVIDFCGELKNVGKKIYVLGDMKELGAESVKSHETVGNRICGTDASQVYLVGPEMKAAEKVVLNKKSDISVKWYNESNDKNFAEIAEAINLTASDNDVILLKGSHSMQLEKLVPLLAKEAE
jgi:UDP-N-acetylmuramoyl-tripeptide--D-alanyl-D-alanine ligase